jgi:hypothetical protein
MIPRSNPAAQGTSKGFDPHQPATVVIHPGGGAAPFELDLRKLDNNQAQKALSAARQSDATTSHDQSLAALRAAAALQAQPAEAPAPPAYVSPVPAEEPPTRTLPTLATTVQLPGPPAPAVMVNEETLRSILGSMLAKPAAAEIKPAVPLAPVAAVDYGMDFLKNHPAKPECEFMLDMGNEAGVILAHYHAIVIGAKCVVLVYDGRYTSGMHWIPGNTGLRSMRADIRFPGSKGKTFTREVGSLGLVFSLGCLDFVVLPALDDQKEPTVPEDTDG